MKGKFQLACNLFTHLPYQSVTLKQAYKAWRGRSVQLHSARLHLMQISMLGDLPTEVGKSGDRHNNTLKIPP